MQWQNYIAFLREKWDFNIFSVLWLLCLCVRLFICALRSPAGKGLSSWLSFVMSNCEFVTFPLVFWVRCGIWLYRFVIFAPLLNFKVILMSYGLINRGSYISATIRALILLNLLNSLRKRDKNARQASHFIFFPTRLINSIKMSTHVRSSIYTGRRW